MKLLWIGSYASDELLKKMPVRSIGQASGITSQKSIIYGIDMLKNVDIDMDTINIQGFPVYPTYPEKHISRQTWSRNGVNLDVSISFNNRRLLRGISQIRSLLREVRSWHKKNEASPVHIIVYEPVISRLMAAKWLKKKDARNKITLIVPDIPEFVGNSSNVVIKKLKLIRKYITDYLRKSVDKYIFYAEPMANYYKIDNDKYIIMEGSFDPRECAFIEDTDQNYNYNDDIVLMYSGAISKGRAIDKFVDSFIKIDDKSLKLWFTGGGDFDDHLYEIIKKDNRITHYGYLDTRAEVLELQSKADILLHIRDKDVLSSKYCFPSKLFEYLVSGKPVITVRIEGIPDQYYQYMIVLDDLNKESLQNAIESVKKKSLEERLSMGREAKKFVLNNKTSDKQAIRIIDFINM